MRKNRENHLKRGRRPNNIWVILMFLGFVHAVTIKQNALDRLLLLLFFLYFPRKFKKKKKVWKRKIPSRRRRVLFLFFSENRLGVVFLFVFFNYNMENESESVFSGQEYGFFYKEGILYTHSHTKSPEGLIYPRII